MIIDDIAKILKKIAISRGITLVEYGIGTLYAYAIVRENNKRAIGVAFVPREDITRGTYIENASINDVDKLVSSYNIAEKCVGVAILNAISQLLIKEEKFLTRGLLELIEFKPNDLVVVIGNMVPIVRALEKRKIKTIVLERNPLFRSEDTLPDCLIKRVLPKATVCIVTGATLVNDTIDLIIDYSKNCRIRAIIGPTAQILPEIFFDLGFTHVASLKITDIEKAKWAIIHGGGARVIEKHGIKYVRTQGN